MYPKDKSVINVPMKENYISDRRRALIAYAQTYKIPTGGTFNYNGKINSYNHIIKSANRASAAKLNIISSVDHDLFDEHIIAQKRLHRCAHHLNSSQLLCYNYFRPMMTADGCPNIKLKQWVMDNIGVQLSEKARCRFEHVVNTKERTNFDFYIKDGDIEIFFEIKYTESMFGRVKYSQRYEKKFEDIYKEMLTAQKCLPINMPMQLFFDNYQLCRNICYVTSCNKFVVFIFPKNNTTVFSQFEAFIPLIQSGSSNVKVVYWENVVNCNSEFFEKYFK